MLTRYPIVVVVQAIEALGVCVVGSLCGLLRCIVRTGDIGAWRCGFSTASGHQGPGQQHDEHQHLRPFHVWKFRNSFIVNALVFRIPVTSFRTVYRGYPDTLMLIASSVCVGGGAFTSCSRFGDAGTLPGCYGFWRLR